MANYYNLEFVDVEIHEDYLISTFKEGFQVKREHNSILLDVVDKFYGDKPFVYISNRKNSYSIDPTIYHEAAKVDNMIAVAIVSENPRQKQLSELEKFFYKKKIKFFKTIEEAIEWKNSILKVHDT